jgi:hypothetical protein
MTRIQTIGSSGWVLILALVALIALAFLLVTPAA